MRNSGDFLSRSEPVILGYAGKWLRSESEAFMRGSRGRGSTTCNGGSRGIRSEDIDGAAALDRGFAMSFFVIASALWALI